MNRKFYNSSELNSEDRPVWVIPESEIQEFAEANFGRELTDIELNRVSLARGDEGEIDQYLMTAFHLAVKYALDEGIDFRATDSFFLED